MDVGKAVHPSHLVFFIENPEGWLIQAYEKWLDGADYNEQVRIINRLIEYFNPVRFYFDSTRSELEDRNLSKRGTGHQLQEKHQGEHGNAAREQGQQQL